MDISSFDWLDGNNGKRQLARKSCFEGFQRFQAPARTMNHSMLLRQTIIGTLVDASMLLCSKVCVGTSWGGFRGKTLSPMLADVANRKHCGHLSRAAVL